MAVIGNTDWTKPMKQWFEYYIVNPSTWEPDRMLTTVKEASISRDGSSQTISTLSLDLDEKINEEYVRVYLVTEQNSITERHCLGTFLTMSPSEKFDGINKSYSVEAYSPLIELREKAPPIGYYTMKGENILDTAYVLASNNCRAPVIQGEYSKKIFSDYVANENDTWLSYISDLLSNAKYNVSLDEVGRITFVPQREFDATSPVWSFNDDNSSILFPSLDTRQDLYNVPNKIEVVASDGGKTFKYTAVNDDSESPTSTVNRKREILKRIYNPPDIGDISAESVEEYAKNALLKASTINCSLTFEHGYCPVNVNDVVRINYTKADLIDIKAKITYQNIKCEPGCTISETATYPIRLWDYR